MNDPISELKRRKENMKEQISILRANSLFGDPSMICDTKEQLFKAEKELEIINIALSSTSKNESEPNDIYLHEYKRSPENSEESNVKLAVAANVKNSGHKINHNIKESIIKKIGIGVVIGVLVLMVAYVFRTHFGIAL